MHGVPVRITNRNVNQTWTYQTNRDGRIWVLAKNTTEVTCYFHKKGFYSELVNFITVKEKDRVEFTMELKPYKRTAFTVKVLNETGAPIEGAKVYFNDAKTPEITTERGIASIYVNGPQVISYRIETQSESYSSSYEITDYWRVEQVIVYMTP